VKKVIKPAEPEESVYYTDFKGVVCEEYGAPVEVKITFNYGSKYDGDELEFHLNDDEVFVILDVIKQHLSSDYKNHLMNAYKKAEKNYESSLQFRDWDSCKLAQNSLFLLEYMLNLNEK
jgi:hypothetical protein